MRRKSNFKEYEQMKSAISAFIAICVSAAAFPYAEKKQDRPAAGYVVAVDEATMSEKGWDRVVRALSVKHDAPVVRFRDGNDLDTLVGFLRTCRPMYVCFVLRPESAGRGFVKAAYEAMRGIDDDPYGDAIWGIITGYSAEDALKVVNAPLARTVKSIATSMGGPGTLDAYDHGIASDERSADNLWVKHPGGKNQKVPVNGNIAKALAKAFSSIPVDYFITSGHASERSWQIIYNQNKGMLVHTKNAELQFVEPGRKVRHDIKGASLRVYLGAGNCLIGHIDSRSCMATAWMHSAGVEQFAGYTVPSWYGFMGWGTASLFGKGRFSLPEAKFLVNQQLLWARSKRHSRADGRGLDYDRDVFAFYGDPKQKILFGKDTLPYSVSAEGGEITVTFSEDCKFPPVDNVRGARPVMKILDRELPGDAIFSEDGKEVASSVLTERFLLIPLSGSYTAGTVLKFRAGYRGGPENSEGGKR